MQPKPKPKPKPGSEPNPRWGIYVCNPFTFLQTQKSRSSKFLLEHPDKKSLAPNLFLMISSSMLDSLWSKFCSHCSRFEFIDTVLSLTNIGGCLAKATLLYSGMVNLVLSCMQMSEKPAPFMLLPVAAPELVLPFGTDIPLYPLSTACLILIPRVAKLSWN